MASRKSSILKPRKVREPLQDLNQLLPNNDEEETTTTDIQKRKVSFASMNKVKEYEAVAERVTLLNTPAYDEISSESCQSSTCGRSVTGSTYQMNLESNINKKSIQNPLKVISKRLYPPDENVNVEEDIELTETNGRIYDIPMKSSGDSSMEMTNIMSQSRMNSLIDCEEIEIICPSNKILDTDTSSMETTNVISAQLIDEKFDDDTSSMETTEVIYKDVLTESIKQQSIYYETGEFYEGNDDAENLCEEIEFIQIKRSTTDNNLNPSRKSIFETDIRKSLVPSNWGTGRKSIFEVEHALPFQNDIPNLNELNFSKNLDYKSVEIPSLEITADQENSFDERRNHECFSKCDINQTNMNISQLSSKLSEKCVNNNRGFIDKKKYDNSNVQWLTLDEENKTKYNNSTMQLVSQEDNNTKKCNNSTIQLMSQEIDDKTKSNNSVMQILSQKKDNKTKCYNSTMELVSQQIDNNTNSNMPLLSQETDYARCSFPVTQFMSLDTNNKTRYSCPSMQLISQEIDDSTRYNSDIVKFTTEAENNKKKENTTIHEINKNSIDKNKLENSNACMTEIVHCVTTETYPAKMNVLTESMFSAAQDESAASVNNLVLNNESSSLLPEKPEEVIKNADNKFPDMNDRNDKQDEIVQKSIIEDNFNSSDSNSPLTVGVNFSIFQKNKETRVEFSGTIDSNQKKKSISNVQVNIINNKVDKQKRNIKDLKFSMPATVISPNKLNEPSDFHATFVSCDSENPKISDNTESESCQERKVRNSEKIQNLNIDSCDTLNIPDNEANNQLTLSKPTKKRLSAELIDNACENEVSTKRPSLGSDVLISQNVENISLERVKITAKKDVAQHSITKVEQKRESFVREEKSVVNVNDEVVDTWIKRTNMNVSSEVLQVITSPVKINKPSNLNENDDETEKRCVKSSKEIDPSNIKNCSPEIRSENDSDRSFVAIHNISYRKNQSINQSMHEEETLHNPSIVVNIGDSFSHYKSMDLDRDNLSMIDIHDSPEKKIEIKNLIESITKDNICKENLVVEWLQNKTGKGEKQGQEKNKSKEFTERLHSENEMDLQSNKLEEIPCQVISKIIDSTVIEDVDSPEVINPENQTKSNFLLAQQIILDSSKTFCNDDMKKEIEQNVANNSSTRFPLSPASGKLQMLSVESEKTDEKFLPHHESKKQYQNNNKAFDLVTERKTEHLNLGSEAELQSNKVEETCSHNVMQMFKNDAKLSSSICLMNSDDPHLLKEINEENLNTSNSLQEQINTCSNETNNINADIEVDKDIVNISTNIDFMLISEKRSKFYPEFEKRKIETVSMLINDEQCSDENRNQKLDEVNIEQLNEKEPELHSDKPEPKCNRVIRELTEKDTKPNSSNYLIMNNPDLLKEVDVENKNNDSTEIKIDENFAHTSTNTNFVSISGKRQKLSPEFEKCKIKSFTALVNNKQQYQEENRNENLDEVNIKRVNYEKEPELHSGEVKSNTPVTEYVNLENENKNNYCISQKEINLDSIITYDEQSKIKTSDNLKCISTHIDFVKPLEKKKKSPEHEKWRFQNHSDFELTELTDIADETFEIRNCSILCTNENIGRKQRLIRAENVRQEILEKIEKECLNNPDWNFRMVMKNKWILQFLFGHLELVIKFTDDELLTNSCAATLQYTKPSNVNYFEIIKISVNSLIKKYESKLETVCQTVEDIPYLLKLINPDIVYTKFFIADILMLADTDRIKIENGRISFYVSSYRNHLLCRIKVGIKHLANLSVNEIKVDQIVGEVDVSSVRKIFSEIGREYNFFSKFVKNLWNKLDGNK